MKEIVLTVDQKGEISVETKGFKGKSCIKESEFLKNALGEEISRELVPAHYEVDGEEIRKKHLNLCG